MIKENGAKRNGIVVKTLRFSRRTTSNFYFQHSCDRESLAVARVNTAKITHTCIASNRLGQASFVRMNCTILCVYRIHVFVIYTLYIPLSIGHVSRNCVGCTLVFMRAQHNMHQKSWYKNFHLKVCVNFFVTNATDINHISREHSFVCRAIMQWHKRTPSKPSKIM